ncbi:MAG TPA: tetratricopeptide repeat protein [Phycisphaerales bacterium]|jgi:tetratricopeptide (TPR) repeat protein|nr:tetratricopeptide repeat protein [Phycisphaerales bacterium]HIB51415.1 tetratricopeptide repeat protein [Phycisphaerales bacterium]HIN83286.1 tetratricopeptide repeat protein [Phycisphaerales bacterium]HIO19569.1 tetratricopeptide repeat protein [Phycisphaerales bacterium]HIO53500.1 tetratricopeptide repeat protein [Phycisphaerales bacterium]
MFLLRFIFAGCLLFGLGCHSISPTVQVEDNSVSLATVTEVQQVTIDAAAIAKEHGDYDEALQLFKEVLQQNPVATDAFVGIGDIYIIKKQWEKAEPAYARAVKLEPRNFDAQYGHAVSLQMMKKFIDAVRAYHRALTINPEDVGANMNIATTYLQIGRPKSALVFAERAVELDGGVAPAQITLAATYQLLGRPQDALNAYIAATEVMEEPSPQLMRNIIYLLTQEKRYQEVVNTTHQLVRLDPTSDTFEQLGWAEFRLGDFEASLRAYQTAVEYDATNWRALNGIGVNQLNQWLLGDKTDIDAFQLARIVFRKSLAINPDQPRVITIVLRYSL